MSKKVLDAVTTIAEALAELSDDERKRAVSSALAIYGSAPSTPDTGTSGEGPAPAAYSYGPNATRWLKRSQLTSEQLDQLFHSEAGEVTLIASKAPGKAVKEQVRNTYLLTGVAALLKSDAPSFSDDAARENCRKLGCYDPSNHGKALAEFGNLVTGSKAAGWIVTAPGLAAAAQEIRDLLDK